MTKNYTEKDIQVLSDFEHIRKRTSMYLGTMHPTTYEVPLFTSDNNITIKQLTFVPAVLKTVNEILDNVTDEYKHNTPRHPSITIEANPSQGQYKIADVGRGVPIGKHDSGKYTPEVVFGSLRSGRNFSDDRQAGIIGMNGIGSSAVCAVSTIFSVDIHRDEKRYKQTFSKGASEISKPIIRSYNGNKTGTTIDFQLDPEVFNDVSIPDELMTNRAIEIALTNPGTAVEYNNNTYKFKKGFEDIISKVSQNYYKFEDNGLEFYVIFDLYQGIDEKIFSWVNGSLLFDGGICNTQFINAFNDKVIKQLAPLSKKEKCEVTKNDVRQDLFIIGNLKIANPEYDSQSKTRLTSPNLRKELDVLIDTKWNVFVKKHKEWFNNVFERAKDRHHAQAKKKAIKEHQKKNRNRIDGLLDATSKDRKNCQLLLTEGLSAKSQVCEARDPVTTGAYALTGKINNVYGCTPAQVLSMGKLTDLLAIIGLTPGKPTVRSELNYGKIVIASDADVDGDDICTILINLFYQFWPELFDPNQPPIVYRLVAPNVVVSKNNKRLHFSSRSEYEKVKEKYRNWNVEYMKGLGSLHKQDWNMILTTVDNLIPILDDGSLADVLELLFGPNADLRKDWLTI